VFLQALVCGAYMWRLISECSYVGAHIWRLFFLAYMLVIGCGVLYFQLMGDCKRGHIRGCLRVHGVGAAGKASEAKSELRTCRHYFKVSVVECG